MEEQSQECKGSTGTKPAMGSCTGCASSDCRSAVTVTLTHIVNSGLRVAETTRRNQWSTGTHRGDNAQYLVNTRIKKLKGSMSGRAKGALLDEL